MARLTPALYHLLPSFAGLDADDGMEVDLFHPDAWQASVVESIEKQVRDRDVSGSELFTAMLAEAEFHRDRMSRLRLSEPTAPAPRGSRVSTNDWLAVAGVDCDTRTGLKAIRDEQGPRFVLSSEERRNHWDSRDGCDRRDTGDGTVPLAGAIPRFLDESSVVRVTPRDFGYWELHERTVTGIADLHAAMPRMNMLHRLIIRFLLDKPDLYDNTWGRLLSGVQKWNPPLDLAQR